MSAKEKMYKNEEVEIMWRKLFRKIGGFLFCLLIIEIVSVGGLMLSSKIPDKWIIENWNTSADILIEQDVYPSLYNSGLTLDNWSDMHLFNIIYYQSKSEMLESAIANHQYNPETTNPMEDLQKVTEGTGPNDSYSRYFLLITLFIKIFLIFGDVTHLRLLIATFSFVLAMWVLLETCRKISFNAAVALFLALLYTRSFYYSLCLSACTDIIIMLLLCIYILYNWNNSKFKKNRIYIYFGIGILTFNMNFLTVPLMTLGIPLIVELLLNESNHETNLLDNIRMTFYAIGAWFAGYISAVLMKQLLALIVLGNQTGTEHLALWGLRSLGIKGRIRMLIVNALRLFDLPMIVITIFIVVYFVFIIIKYRNTRVRMDKKLVIPLLLLGVLPCIWLFTFAFHATHGFDAYYYIISIFSFLSIFFKYISLKKESADADFENH